ncbi:MAG: BrnT family toxin [Anaerolineae bacterium]
MKIIGLVWLEDIVEKLEMRHAVQQQEVREVFANRPLILMVEKGHRPGENVYAVLGQTDAGRYLAVFFVHKKDGRALIVSARDMTRAERRRL